MTAKYTTNNTDTGEGPYNVDVIHNDDKISFFHQYQQQVLADGAVACDGVNSVQT